MITLIACAVCGLIGWWHAHATVAKECKKLGKFYVGNEVFHCTKIETIEEETRARLRRSIHENGPGK